MLGESHEQIEAAERCRVRRALLTLAFPPSLLRWRPDVAAREFDRLLAGPEPRPSRWNPWRTGQRLAWECWRVLLALQAQRARLDGCATL